MSETRKLADPERDIWDRKDVAHYLGCSTPTVGALIKRDGLPVFKAGRMERFRRVDVVRFVEEKAHGTRTSAA